MWKTYVELFDDLVLGAAVLQLGKELDEGVTNVVVKGVFAVVDEGSAVVFEGVVDGRRQEVAEGGVIGVDTGFFGDEKSVQEGGHVVVGSIGRDAVAHELLDLGHDECD